MSNIRCCYGCEDRKVGCHSECERYINEKKIYDEKRELVQAEKNAKMLAYKASVEGIQRMQKNRRLRRRK